MIDASAVERERTLRRDSILSLITGAAMPTDSLLITDFGAKGDGVKDCKRAFDRAMRAAGKRGGAKIIVPEGVYLVKGPIHFVSNVCLDLRKGATIKFAPEPKYYLPVVETSWEGCRLWGRGLLTETPLLLLPLGSKNRNRDRRAAVR